MSAVLEGDISAVLLKTKPLILATDDAEGRIIWANPLAELLFRVGRVDGILGRSVDELVPESMRERHSQHRLEYSKNPVSKHLAIQALRDDGTIFDAMVHLMPWARSPAPCVLAEVFEMPEMPERPEAAIVELLDGQEAH